MRYILNQKARKELFIKNFNLAFETNEVVETDAIFPDFDDKEKYLESLFQQKEILNPTEESEEIQKEINLIKYSKKKHQTNLDESILNRNKNKNIKRF
ncbi:MAG: hypothetical protein ACTSWK_07275 [Promethearchaeota archaeon]